MAKNKIVNVQKVLEYLQDYILRFQRIAEEKIKEVEKEGESDTIIDSETAFYKKLQEIVTENSDLVDDVNRILKELSETNTKVTAIGFDIQKKMSKEIVKRKDYMATLVNKLSDLKVSNDDIRHSLELRTIFHEGAAQIGYRNALALELRNYLEKQPQYISVCVNISKNWIEDDSLADNIRETGITLYNSYHEKAGKPNLFELMPEIVGGILIDKSKDESLKRGCWSSYINFIKERFEAGTIKKSDYELLIEIYSRFESGSKDADYAGGLLRRIDQEAYKVARKNKEVR